jgi:fibronectin-binding autotransporter adhesin
MSIRLVRPLQVALALAVLALPSAVLGQTATNATYTGTAATGNWSTGPWVITNGGPDAFPNDSGVATFAGGVFTIGASGYIGANVNVTQDLAAGVTLSGINFSNVANAFAYTVSGGNSVTFVDPTGSPGAGATISLTSLSNLGNNTLSAPVTLNTNLTITSATNNLAGFTFSSPITSAGSMSLTIATTAPHDESGLVSLASSASTFAGGVKLNSGNLQIAASSSGSPSAVTSGPFGTGILTINPGAGALVTNPGLTSAGTAFTIGNDIVLNANLNYAGFGSVTVPLTLSGLISGAGGVTNRSRGGFLLLTNADSYTGPTVAMNEPIPLTNAQPPVGTISFSGSGSALNSTAFTAQGGATILLDNSTVGASISRIGIFPVTVNNGTFRLNGSTAATGSFTQSAGTLTSNGGFATIIVNPVSASNEGVELNFASLSRGPTTQNGTFLFNAGTATFGGTAGAQGVSRITFNSAPALVGAGAPGSTAAQIIPYAFGTAGNATGTGTDLVTYDSNGVRLLTSSEYAASNSSLSVGANNKLTAAGATITTASNLSIQSLIISPASGNDTFSGAGTLTVTAGTILSTSSGNNIINNNLNFGTAEGVLFITSSLANNININGVISGSGGLTKSGPGVLNLILGAAGPTVPNATGNTYTGQTTLGGGLTVINDSRVFGADTSPIQFWGATSGNNAGITNTAAGVVVNLSRNLVINDGFVSLNGNNSRTAMLATGNISGGGAIYIASGSTGGMTWLSGTNTYTGETRIDSGTLVIASDANIGSGPVDLGTNITAANPPLGIRLYGNWTTSKLMNVSSSSSFDTGAFTATLNGPLTEVGVDYIVKFGTGTLNFANAQNGLLGLIVDNGTVKLSGAAQLINATSGAIAINSGKLQLDYTTSAAPKLSTSQNVQFGAAPSGIANGGGGILELDAGGTVVNQQVGTLTIPLSSAATVAPSVASIRLSSGGGGGAIVLQATNLNYSNSTATANTMLFVAGDSLGTTTKLLVNNFQVTGAGTGATNALIGGAYGTDVGLPSLGILRGGYGDNNSAGNGTGLLTYDSSVTNAGVRLLAASEYQLNSTAAFGGGTSPNANVKVTAPTTSTAGDTINSLVVQDGNTLTVPSGGTLNVISGTILSTGSAANVIAGGGTNGGGGTLAGTTTGAVSGFNFAVATDLTVKTVLTGTGGSLIKMGPGTLTFDPLNAAGASVTTSAFNTVAVYGGTLAVTDTAATLGVLGTGPFFLANNATLRFGGVGVTTTRVLNLFGSGGTLDLPGTFWQTSGTTALIAGSGALTLTSGTFVIGVNQAQANTYQGGTNVMTGSTLVINATGAFLGVGGLNLQGGTLAARAAGTGITRAIAVETSISANTNFVNNLVVTGLSADTFNAALSFTTPTRLENSVTLTSNMAGSAAVTFAGSIYDNPFNSPATLTLAAGTSTNPFIFSGSNSYRGGTIVNSGILRVNNTFGSGTGTGSVTVNSGGTLGGSGFILPATGNTVTIASGGVVSPGNSIGTLTLGSPTTPTTLNLNGTYTDEVAAAGSTDLLVVSGNLSLGAASILNVSGTLDGTSTYTILTYTGTYNLTHFFQENNVASQGYMVVYPTTGTGGGAIQLSPVPEPTAVLGMCAAAAGVFGWVRRRRV